ncbi:MobF family relaxase [Nocardioides iriomotensis]|nr:MobF family relaxase [Nocardioides iriomotensis]
MTLHKLHAGDGYTYLTRQVAAGDESRSHGQQLADYYTASGNPPGRWMGSGAADLAVEGRVREDQMRSLFGAGLHPDAEQIIALETAAGTDPAIARAAAKLGRAFPKYKPFPPRSERVAARLRDFEDEHGRVPSPQVRSKIEAQEARRDRRAVAGYDLVFTPVKSASLLWALGSTSTREAVEAAHHEAVADTLAWLERETAFARTGDRGEAQIETRGFLATAFDHRDSRAGDPDLHTHLAISNKVRAREDHADGSPRWLSLDARVIHAAAVAASERYNTRFEDGLSRRLGVAFTQRPDSVRDDKRPIREITGVPVGLLKHFSKRRAAIEDRYRTLHRDYRSTHGHEPDASAQLKLAQQATLETRDGKAPPKALAEKLADWRTEATTVLADRTVRDVESQALGRDIATPPPDDLQAVAEAVVATVSMEKATWTRWNITAETERQLRPFRFSTPADREAATAAVIRASLHPDSAVQLTADGTERTLEAVAQTDPPRRSNGESVLVEHGSARYTTQDLLDAEQRLLDHAHTPTRHGINSGRLLEFIAGFEARYNLRLDRGQRALVLGFAADPRRLVVGIGPAGAGKTTAMRAVAEAWRTTGRRVIPLAPSATAAEVLGDELGCRAENLHKFHHTHASDQSSTASRDPWFALQPGDLILVDEAGMASTRHLDWLTTYARERGAIVRLLGDPAQLNAVEAGGMLRLLAHDTDAVELSDLHRFTDPDEAIATLAIRNGDPTAIDYYARHARLTSGSPTTLLDAAYEGWATDTANGHTSLLIAGTKADVTKLNRRARAERIHSGDVEPDGVRLHDGTTAGNGDLIITRHNDRSLTSRAGTRFVRNGDTWRVTHRHQNGDITARHTTNGADVRLPHHYVNSHVDLGYATTTAQAQGRTVDTTHAIIDTTTDRAQLYVAATRARHHTQLYVPTCSELGLDADQPPAVPKEVTEQLAQTITRDANELTATEIQRQTGHRQRTQATPRSRTPAFHGLQA